MVYVDFIWGEKQAAGRLREYSTHIINFFLRVRIYEAVELIRELPGWLFVQRDRKYPLESRRPTWGSDGPGLTIWVATSETGPDNTAVPPSPLPPLPLPPPLPPTSAPQVTAAKSKKINTTALDRMAS